jgi:hypothetical protein
MAEPHESAAVAVAALGLSTTNAGAIPDAQALQPFVREAVRAAEKTVADQTGAVTEEASARVERWIDRTRAWRGEAVDLYDAAFGAAKSNLQRRSVDVDDEARIAAEMRPARTLLRPLIVVVPQDIGSASVEGQVS